MIVNAIVATINFSIIVFTICGSLYGNLSEWLLINLLVGCAFLFAWTTSFAARLL